MRNTQKQIFLAAHCFLPKNSFEILLSRDVRALFGVYDLDGHTEPRRYALSPKQIILHTDWNPHEKNYDADVSLLEFEEGDIHFNNYIQPICLWGLKDEPQVSAGIVVGWGKSEDRTKIHENVPKLLPVSIKTNEYCLPQHGTIADLSSHRTFCALGLRNGSGVCHGDSGSGLVIAVNGLHYLRGIVSASLLTILGCDVFNNAVYSNVLDFRDWIAEKTGEAGEFEKLQANIFNDIMLQL